MFPRDVKGKPRLSFFDPNEKKLHTRVCVFGEDYKGQCVGFSHGWLALLDNKGNLSIFNPFSGDNVHIQFGSLTQELGLICLTFVEAFPRGLVAKLVIVMPGSNFNKVSCYIRKRQEAGFL